MPTFDFGEEFQEAVLALMIQTPDVGLQLIDIIKAEYFTAEELETLYVLMQRYYTEYRQIADKDALVELVRDENAYGRIKDDALDMYASLIARLLQMDLSRKKDYLLERAVDFCKRQEFVNALYAGVDLVNEANYDEAANLVTRALQVGASHDLGHFFFTDIALRAARRLNPDYNESLPTGIRDLDKILKGGITVGELGVIMAASGVGKSIGLTHIGKIALLMGKTVFHYSMELHIPQLAGRYDSALTGVPYDKLGRRHEDVTAKLKKIHGVALDERLLLKAYPTKTATVGDVRAHIRQMEGRGIVPDLVIVDYGDIMLSSRAYQQRRHEEASIFEELRGMGSEFGFYLWTATQANRNAVNKALVTEKDIAESYAKVQTADIILTLCQTEEELAAQVMRIFIAKNRDGKKHKVIKIHTDFERMQFARRKGSVKI